MSNPIRVRIRCPETVREKWMEAKGRFDLTHAELARECAKFVLSNEAQFRRQLSGDEKPEQGESRTSARPSEDR